MWQSQWQFRAEADIEGGCTGGCLSALPPPAPRGLHPTVVGICCPQSQRVSHSRARLRTQISPTPCLFHSVCSSWGCRAPCNRWGLPGVVLGNWVLGTNFILVWVPDGCSSWHSSFPGMIEAHPQEFAVLAVPVNCNHLCLGSGKRSTGN